MIIVTYLIQAALKLRDAGAGYGVKVTAVAALQEVVSNSGYHSSVVAAKL